MACQLFIYYLLIRNVVLVVLMHYAHVSAASIWMQLQILSFRRNGMANGMFVHCINVLGPAVRGSRSCRYKQMIFKLW